MSKQLNKNQLLGNLPQSLRDELFDEYNKLVRNYRESRWEPSEMSGGKLCEITYSILNGYVSGNFPSNSTKPANMVDSCKQLERAGSQFKRTIRIQIPRVLIAVYEVRNNRGAGHVGGDINPNHMDATFVLHAAKWILSELIRVFHGVDTETAQDAVDLITERETPLIWTVGNVKRVQDTKLSKFDQTMVLLHMVGAEKDTVLFGWVEHSNLSVYRSQILKKGHKQRLWEYDSASGDVVLSATGVTEAEKLLQRQN